MPSETKRPDDRSGVSLWWADARRALTASASADSPALQACKTLVATSPQHPGTPGRDAAFAQATKILVTIASAERYACERSIQYAERSKTVYSEPTKAERDEAAAYVRGFKTQSELFAPER